MLVAATNPCPCGYFGSVQKRCKCTPNQIERYLAKISGPMLDRIDIHIDVPSVTFSKLRSKETSCDSAAIRQQVIAAREIQRNRFGEKKTTTNATMVHRQVGKFCDLDTAAEMVLKNAMTEFGLSARAHDKICKVARTIADLEEKENVLAEHIAEAVSYRKLDRSL
jgi:magnesium chelatase family protein